MVSVVRAYSWECTINELSLFQDFKTTPSFSLLPDVDLTLCFKYLCKIIGNFDDCRKYSLLKLSLMKLQSSDALSSLDFEVNVIVNYSDGSRYHEYKTMKCNTRKLKEVVFEDVSSRYYELKSGVYCLTVHSNKMKTDSFILKCCLKINEDLSKNSVLASPTSNFIKDFSSIYEPAVLSDVKIYVGDKYLLAHKAILAARSPVFLKMFTNDFKESQTSTITITDFGYDEFKIFLKYLYTAEIEDPSWPNIEELYKLADKYDVSSLKIDCQKRILLLMNEDIICDILVLIYDHEDNDIKEKVKQYAVTHIKSIIPTEGWKSMVASHLHIGFDIAMKFVPV